MRKDNFTAEDHLYAGGWWTWKNDWWRCVKDRWQTPLCKNAQRRIRHQHGYSFKAYYHLEGKGLIESRPKSGYYVRFNQKRFPELPKMVQPDPLSHDVSVKEMIASIYADIATHSNKIINFALAAPDASLLPTAKINKSVMQALRNSTDSCISYEHTQGNFELRNKSQNYPSTGEEK